MPKPTEPAHTRAAIETLRDAWEHERDFAGWLASALAAVAADLGSTEALLAGRPDSWEAAHVRQLLAGTVGEDDEYLSQFAATS
jgi:hypothetical protein